MSKKLDLVIFGATGDLCFRKLLPALVELEKGGLLNELERIIGASRTDLSPEQWRDDMTRTVPGVDTSSPHWQTLLARMDYVPVDSANKSGFTALAERLTLRDNTYIYYLAVPPSIYGEICAGLHIANIVQSDSRVVLEKPLGRDLASCQLINEDVAKVFVESCTFRIDHYLGKETVQNLLALRFGNILFEPLWNNRYVDNIQITVAESLGVEGRSAFYGETGALRDMLQNHLLQVLCMTAMEPPPNLEGDAVRDEKVKVLRSLRLFKPEEIAKHTVRGQYAAGTIEGEPVCGFLEEQGFANFDMTETFAAVRASIDNWRWAGVPFYLRTGKRLAKRQSEVVVEFKNNAFALFPQDHQETSNKLVIQIQPTENINLRMVNKKAGLSDQLKLQTVNLDLSHSQQSDFKRYAAYERLLLDVFRGNQTLFMRRDEVEAAWAWSDSITDSWDEIGLKPKAYPAGSMGPNAALALPEREGRSWHE